MEATRRTSLLAGLFFILTFVASIPAALYLYKDVVDDPTFVLGAGGENRVYLGAFLEVITVIANIATAVVLFPVVKRASESVALGYVASRTVESTLIVVGLISLLAVVAMRAGVGAAGADPLLSVTAGRSLVAVHDATFLLGPAFCAGLGNGILLGYLMYRAELVPRAWAVLGMVGGTIAFGTATAVLFGAYEQASSINALFTLPEIAWEGFLGIYLTFWGFRKATSSGAPHVEPAALVTSAV